MSDFQRNVLGLENENETKCVSSVGVKFHYYNEFVLTFVWISLLPNTWKTVLFNIQKGSALSDKKKKKHFTDILECSINKKLL